MKNRIVRCAIIEDDKQNQDLVRSYIFRHESLKLVGVCSYISNAQQLLQEKEVDLLFLDVELQGGGNGLEFYKGLEEKPHVIIMTAHLQYAVESYAEHLTGFLFKPFDYYQFKDMVDHVIGSGEAEKKFNIVTSIELEMGNYIPIVRGKTNEVIHKVLYSDIAYMEQCHNNVTIYTIYDTYYDVLRCSISSMEAELPYFLFQRINKSIIINKQNAKSVVGGFVDIIGKTFKMSRRYYSKNSNKY